VYKSKREREADQKVGLQGERIALSGGKVEKKGQKGVWSGGLPAYDPPAKKKEKKKGFTGERGVRFSIISQWNVSSTAFS